MAARFFQNLVALTLLSAQLALLPSQLANSEPDLKPHSFGTYIIHANHLAKPPHFASLEHWYASMVMAATHSSPRAEAADSSRILYTYDTVMHGFAVRLTGDEARRMASTVGVTAVHEDRLLRPRTTRTPGFLGLDPGFGAWKDTESGDGVIIGFVDSGIWPESASFSDRGLGPVRSSWRGTCVGAGDFNASLCNRKLVGAKTFGMGDADGGNGNSPRDKFGHGTHVASTAAGSVVRGVGVRMFARGTARGVAPKARIAAYKVSGMMTAVAAAVKDGVDIVSLSLGDDNPHLQFFNDSLAIAAFGAERSGVFVVLAGGNDGPNASTVTNVAPWMTTVGAATVDRLFPAYLRLGDGAVLTGQSLYARNGGNTTMTPLLLTSCTRGVPAEKTKGKILVCMDADAARRRKSSSGRRQAPNAGGHDGPAGVVDVDTDGWSQGIGLVLVDASTPPMLVLSLSAGEQLKAYVASTAYPVASFSFPRSTVIAENRAPMVASFSSRGPNPVAPQLLKPDLVAPGQDVLAAWKGGGYVMLSGTSMSCPHVAGVAALVRKKHPGWTPAMVRSALVTTAATLDNTGRAILDNAVFRGRGATAATPFAAGAGHVRPQLAMDPGLVYDAGATDYVDFLCALGYSAEQMRVFVAGPGLQAACSTRPPLPGGPAGLNYPSFVVAFGGRGDVVSLTRTVTKVSEGAESYAVTVEAPEHVEVTITPAVLEFKERMETLTYTAEFRVRAEAGRDQESGWDFGHLVWESEKHQVRSPVAFHFDFE